jgi:two-component system, OmpR family, response regulator
MKVLIVEDNRKLAALISRALESEGMEVERCYDGHCALNTMKAAVYDVIVMDLMLPGVEGLEVIRRMRHEGIDTPVLIVSARGDSVDRIEGFRAGADQYLSKPFSTDELVARLHSLLRKRSDPQKKILYGDLQLLSDERSASRAGRPIELTEKEYRLLEFLLQNRERVCSRSMILEHVWHYHFDPGTNIVDVYIRKLREKVDADSEIRLIQSVRGQEAVLHTNNSPGCDTRAEDGREVSKSPRDPPTACYCRERFLEACARGQDRSEVEWESALESPAQPHARRGMGDQATKKYRQQRGEIA